MNLTLARLRLHHQQISVSKFKTAAEVVRWLGAVQAQDYLGSLWAIGLRLKKSTEADIEKAIADKTIVRSWPMRGTLHFVAPEDVRWMLKFLTPRVIKRSAGHYREAELDNKVFSKTRKIFEKSLIDGKQLTRNEMYDALERSKISTREQRGLHILAHHAQEGLICFGARKGKQQTFTLLDEWLPPTKSLNREEALEELARRYFNSHGPATIDDFAWWAGLTKNEAILACEAVRSEFLHETIEGKTYWLSSSGVTSNDKSKASYLLPSYDEYLVSYKDRSAALNPAFRESKQGLIFTPTVITKGIVTGIWKRTLGKNEALVKITSFDNHLKNKEVFFKDAVKQYSRFVETPVRLE